MPTRRKVLRELQRQSEVNESFTIPADCFSLLTANRNSGNTAGYSGFAHKLTLDSCMLNQGLPQ